MAKKFHKKLSKRMPAKTRYKIEKRVKDHHKKQKKEAKKNPKKKTKKDLGVPNSLPFKDKILQEAVERKKRAEELREKQKDERHKLLMKRRNLEDLQKDAQKRADVFDDKLNSEVAKDDNKITQNDSSLRAYYKEFRKVVEAADVILEVLDARDPLGSRCRQVEEAVINSGARKRLVLVLNKVDLIPRVNLVSWLKYLRRELPTVPFKASTQSQRKNLSQSKVPLVLSSTDLVQSSQCLGADVLMKILKGYCHKSEVKTAIRVGVVGFPNVGKSSIINSLKRSRATTVGATPGVTKAMQEIQLDKFIMLLDSPGIVLAKDNDQMSVLRNATKVENVPDPVVPVEAIMRRCSRDQLMLMYRLPAFETTADFLGLLAKRFGRMKKGGIPHLEQAARTFLNDWNMGKIKYFTHPPEVHEMPTHISAEIVQEMSAAFNIEDLMDAETVIVESLPSVTKLDGVSVQSMGLTDCAETEDKMEDDQEDANSISKTVVTSGTIATGGICSKPKKETSTKFTTRLKKASKAMETDMALEENMNQNRAGKKAFKKMKKQKKKEDKVATDLSETMTSSLNFQSSNNDNYEFGVDYK